MDYTEAYWSKPHKESRRLTQRLRKIAISGWKLAEKPEGFVCTGCEDLDRIQAEGSEAPTTSGPPAAGRMSFPSKGLGAPHEGSGPAKGLSDPGRPLHPARTRARRRLGLRGGSRGGLPQRRDDVPPGEPLRHVRPRRAPDR